MKARLLRAAAIAAALVCVAPGFAQVDRTVLARLRALDGPTLRSATTHCLSDFEVDAVMKRRDVLVAHFDALIAAKGARAVLYGAEPQPQ